MILRVLKDSEWNKLVKGRVALIGERYRVNHANSEFKDFMYHFQPSRPFQRPSKIFTEIQRLSRRLKDWYGIERFFLGIRKPSGHVLKTDIFHKATFRPRSLILSSIKLAHYKVMHMRIMSPSSMHEQRRAQKLGQLKVYHPHVNSVVLWWKSINIAMSAKH